MGRAFAGFDQDLTFLQKYSFKKIFPSLVNSLGQGIQDVVFTALIWHHGDKFH
jgi:hypothetical protein